MNGFIAPYCRVERAFGILKNHFKNLSSRPFFPFKTQVRNMEGGTSKAATKRGTPNKRWKPDFDNVLIPVLVEQVRQGLKCDKSFKRAAFGHAASAVNARFNTNFTPENVENHYRTLKVRYMEIKKARDLSGADWDDKNKVIILDPLVAFTYTEAHPGAKPFINKPIENYEGLRIICGEDSATGSYAASLFLDFADKSENEGTDNDNGESDPVDIASDVEGVFYMAMMTT
ncbi:uncharacterized protein LOC120270578 isoform X2 [Dioscorea cayenensis subsp. rotundata]|uniref:Uncharacterized protein LOC120270578 isoform X2 n=1 Tax=Dioscorea cayennensis subsp. rotundata TaxID=55577 RepID=A0AB40C5A4_DIOCR|nr:uncharacterized protein LOC120270578 isoform X2 [Dioscorea cayenensis subsp. rotundata]